MKSKLPAKRIVEKVIDVCYKISVWFVGFVIFYLFAQIFLLTSFSIPTDSMEPSIWPGDKILVEKVSMGGRLFNLQKAFRQELFSISRVPGFSSVRHNDVVVFNWPHPKTWDKIEFDISRYYVKRCIGLPGDTLEIRDAIYSVKGVESDLGNIVSQQGWQEHLKQRLSSHREDNDTFFDLYWTAFPRKKEILDWNVLNFGPFYIPRKGDLIPMDTVNYYLYRLPIEWEQGQTVSLQDGKVWLGTEVLTIYQFTHDYYFVAGDKVENSQDSRYWGLLPDDFIVGKAWHVFYSKNQDFNTFRWNRTLKKIH